jgi:hypothetical protein
MIKFFDSTQVDSIFQNENNTVLLIFLNENRNNQLGNQLLQVLNTFDEKCRTANKETTIVWFIKPDSENESIQNLWNMYNSDLTVPYCKFVTRTGVDTNIGYSGMPSVDELFQLRNLI